MIKETTILILGIGNIMVLPTKYKTELIRIIHKHLPSCKIYLFGSYAIGKERPGSDIDLALDREEKIPHDIILKILIDIDDTTIPMKVDLIDIHKAPEELKKDILTEGILWTN